MRTTESLLEQRFGPRILVHLVPKQDVLIRPSDVAPRLIGQGDDELVVDGFGFGRATAWWWR